MVENRPYIINGQAFTTKELDTFTKWVMFHGKDWEKEHFSFIYQWMRYRRKEFIFQTSGTTGPKKDIKFTKEQVMASVSLTIEKFGLTKGKTTLIGLPGQYIAAKMMTIRGIEAKMAIYYAEPSSNPLLKASPHLYLDIVPLVPLQLDDMLHRYDMAEEVDRRIKIILVGGAPVSQKIKDTINQLTSTAVFETYGMTETISHIAVRKLNGEDKQEWFHTLGEVTVSLNESNCLVIHAPHLQLDPIITHDIGEIKDQKTFRIIGRFDDIINSGGIKVHPAEIEEHLEKVISQRFFITSLPDYRLGSKVVLAIEGAPWNSKQLDPLKVYLEKSLSKYHQPKEILFISHFKTTPSGKLIKRLSEY